MTMNKVYLKNVFFLLLFTALTGCSTSTLNQLSGQLTGKSTPGGQTTQGQQDICSINIKSDVNGVNVAIEEKSSWNRKDKIKWVTNGTYKKIEVTCSDHTVDLSKECYAAKKIDVNFSTDKTADVYVNKNQWMKFAYLRTEYISGDVPSVKIKGLSPDLYEIRKNENLVKKVEVGNYAIDIIASNKITTPHVAPVCQENEIYILQIKVLPPGDITANNGMEFLVPHGKGKLRFVNDKSNAIFTFYSVSSGKSEKLKAPIVLPEVPYGDYKIEYGSKKMAITVNSDSPPETVIDLSSM